MNELMKIEVKNKKTLSSLELLEQINLFRQEEYKEKRKNNTLTEAEKRKEILQSYCIRLY